MTALIATLVGGMAYLSVGRILGLVSFADWPGTWRRRVAKRSTDAALTTRARQRIREAALSAGAGVICAFLALGLTDAPWLAAPAGVLGATLPSRRKARVRARRQAELHESWPDGLRHLVASVRSGLTVEAAVVELAHTGPDALRRLLARFEGLAATVGTGAALEAVAESAADPTTDRVISVLTVANEVGGRVVPGILEDLADAVTRDLRASEEIRTTALEQRLNARIVFVVPWAVLLLLTSRPGLYRVFYRSRPGIMIVIVAALLSAGALLVLGRLGKEPLEERVLVGEHGGAP